MKTLEQFADGRLALPTRTSWYLWDLAEATGKQELFKRQTPQRLKALREHALVESAVSSNRIEGVEADRSRVGTLVFGRSALRDRDEEEIRGYRDALSWIHGDAAHLEVSVATVLELHRLCRGLIWDAGQLKSRDVDIVETDADGGRRVRFRTVPASETATALDQTLEQWRRGMEERWVPVPVLLAALNLDFLCVHPFRDGNGRVSRLLLLLTCYHAGIEVGRYISLERMIEENKERYYETLEISSRGWHEGRHDPWPYIDFLLYILKTTFDEFERRVGDIRAPRGAKSQRIRDAVERTRGPFTVGQLHQACPETSLDLIRKTLKTLRDEGAVECLGRGRNAQWRKKSVRSLENG